MSNLMTFNEAISDSEKYRSRHLLLGNGFSMACMPHVFGYDSLLEKSDFGENGSLRGLFDHFKTKDFEEIINVLENNLHLRQYSDPSNETDGNGGTKANILKEILIQTIAKVHPKTPGEISINQYNSCKRFLEHFIGYKVGDGKVFTLNYDLLLYWSIISDSDYKRSNIKLASNDGFSRDEKTNTEYVKWIGNHAWRHSQQIHYLHGSLHLFYSGNVLQKYTWRYTGKSLIGQIREAMNDGKFPLFVAEGDSEKKMKKISRDPYLYFALQNFRHQMAIPESSLFVFGFKFSDNDIHIIDEIREGKIRKMYVGLYTKDKTEEIESIETVVNELKHSRSESYPIDIQFFDSESANVWSH